MTHSKAAARNRAIAQRIAAGGTIGAVALEFDVCIGTVYAACRIHGVRCRQPPKTFNTYELIGILCRDNETPMRELAERYGSSVEAISVVYRRCVAEGIPVKPRKQGRPKFKSDT